MDWLRAPGTENAQWRSAPEYWGKKPLLAPASWLTAVAKTSGFWVSR
nr:hypothetical protein [Streptomyces sp. KM273126]